MQEILRGVKELCFERDTINYPIISPNQYWHEMVRKPGSMIQLIQYKRESNNEKIESLRKEYLKTIEPYITDNVIRFDYLLTIATKV